MGFRAAWPLLAAAHFTGLLVLTGQLLPPFHLQEGKVSVVENKFCNMLYGQRLSKDKNYSVYEEMLYTGDFLTGKAICSVSEAISLLPLPELSVFLGFHPSAVSPG